MMKFISFDAVLNHNQNILYNIHTIIEDFKKRMKRKNENKWNHETFT